MHIEIDRLTSLVVDTFPPILTIFQYRRDDLYRGLIILDRRQIVATQDKIIELVPLHLQRTGTATILLVQLTYRDFRHLRIPFQSLVEIRLALAETRRGVQQVDQAV